MYGAEAGNREKAFEPRLGKDLYVEMSLDACSISTIFF